MFPNLPENKPRAMVVNPNMEQAVINFIKDKNIDVIYSQKIEAINSSVAYHPDVQLFHAEDNIYVCEPSLYDYYSEALSVYGAKVIKGSQALSSNYPGDIAYNIARVGMTSFQKIDSTDETSLSHLKRLNVALADVPQGYAKCNVCVVDDNSIITSDASIYKAAKENAVDALLIDPGGILLDGFSYGFIGGASFKLDKDTLCFMGDIKGKTDYTKILSFVSSKGIECVMASEKKVEDFGSVIHIF